MSLNLRKKKLKPSVSTTTKRRKTGAKVQSNPFTIAKKKAENSKSGVVEKLSALRAVTQIEDEEYLLALLKHANYNIEAGIKNHFEDAFFKSYKLEQERCSAKSDAKAKADGYPKLLRRCTVFVESTTSLNVEEADELFSTASNGIYSVTAEGGSIVRVGRKCGGKLVTFGRLPRQLGQALGSLLEAGFVAATVDVELAPPKLEILTLIPVQLSIWLETNDVFTLFEKSEQKKEGKLALAFFSLVNRLFGDQLLQKRPRTSAEAILCDPQSISKGCEEALAPTPEGLTCQLYKHQQFGLQWMLQRENDGGELSQDSSLWRPVVCDSEAEFTIFVNSDMQQCSLSKPINRAVCKGGILADEMGMGKTVCVISLILASRPQSTSGSNVFSSSSRDITLIVCPASLLGQWRREVVGKVKSTHKLSHLVYHGSANRCNSLGEYEVVITSYGQVSSELGSNSSRLFRMKWSRVILDEGHLIKNAKTNLSRACAKLRAQKRWILTGTPIQNSLEDLYSFFKFFHLEPWCSAHYWAEAIAKPFECGKSKEILAKLHRLLNETKCPLMLRRKKCTAGLLEESKKVVEIVKIALAKGEREFYECVLQRSKTEFEGYTQAGQAKEKYAAIFTLLLRLRQTCDHPFLVLKGGDDESEKENLSTNVPTHGNLKETMKAQTSDYARRILDEWTQEEGAKERECPICLEDVQEPVMTTCAHVVCNSCLTSFINKYSDSGCPVCRTPIDLDRVVHLDRLNRANRIDAYKSKANMKRSSKMNWLFRSLEEIHQVNTQKLKGKLIVEKYLSGENDDVREKPVKVVIFSQWTSFLSMLEDQLSTAGKRAVRLDGSMTSQAREAAIEKFHNDKNTWIFLISLRAGSLGLNLTVASVMYIMDPWFNPTVEEQAIDRCHRLGQLRPVHVYRPVVENSVEERMLDLQVQKSSMAKSVLDQRSEAEDPDIGKKKVLSFEELASFFK